MTLKDAFEQLRDELCTLLSAVPEVGLEIEFRITDMVHHMLAALAWFEDATALHWDALDEPRRILGHEAHHSLVALGQVLRDREGWPDDTPEDVIARVNGALDALLDALEPSVTRADAALRRVLLDGESRESALARLAAR